MKRKQIENYLENECAFRDYRFVSATRWGKLSVGASINLLNPEKHDLDDALNVFTRDGYSSIVIYLDSVKKKELGKCTCIYGGGLKFCPWCSRENVPDSKVSAASVPTSGHTPGPWKYTRESVRMSAVRGPDGKCITWIGVELVPREQFILEQAEANARLIAAAPELLASLKTILVLSKSIDTKEPMTIGKLAEIEAQAKFYIAAAEGEEK